VSVISLPGARSLTLRQDRAAINGPRSAWLSRSQPFWRTGAFFKEPPKSSGAVKVCAVPQAPSDFVGIGEWLADVSGEGISLVEQTVAADPIANKGLISAMSLDPTLKCNESFATVTPSDIKAIITDGRAGVAGLAANESVPFSMDQDGKVRKLFPGGDSVYVGFQIPEQMRAGLRGPGFSVMINNSRILVAVIGEAKKSPTKPPRRERARPSERSNKKAEVTRVRREPASP